MLTQKRFEELVDLGRQGNIGLMQAIRLAEHETFNQEVEKSAVWLKIVFDCAKFFTDHSSSESVELLNRCNDEIEKIRKQSTLMDNNPVMSNEIFEL